MLENITLENFKGFKKLDSLKIKPITILCGANSCGKTSILQSILLLKQTLESKNPNQTLLLNGRFVKLGYFKDLIHKKKSSEKITFDLCFTITPDIYKRTKRKGLPLGFIMSELIGSSFSEQGDSEYLIDYQISLKTTATDNASHPEHLQPLRVVDVCIKIIEKKNDVTETLSDLTLTNKENDTYVIEWMNIKNRFARSLKQERKVNSDSGKIEAKIKFANLFPSLIKIDEEKEADISHVRFFISMLNDFFQEIFQSHTYLGPLRGEPEREYIYRDEILEIGNKGENAAYLYLSEKDVKIEDHFFYNKKKDSFEAKTTTTIKDAVNQWFDLMNIKNFEATISNKIIYLNMVASSYDDTEVGIADVGFGISQIFPIILEGLRMDKGNTLLLEQPEIHLHPNLQMQLSDYFVSLALSGKSVIVETHSDHIINRLVRRIVEDEKFDLKDKIGIYFIKSTENGSIYEEINIDDTKGITNWPVDFFDQTANEQMKIMQAGLKKRKSQKIKAEK